MIPEKIFVKQEESFFKNIIRINPRNRYLVFDENKNNLFYAYEKSNTFLRLFLKPMRPLTIKVIYYNNPSINEINEENFQGNVLLEIKRKFTLGFSRFYIYKKGILSNIIQTKSDFFNYIFYVLDKEENLIFFTRTTYSRVFKIFPSEEEFKKNYKIDGTELASISRVKIESIKDIFSGEILGIDFKNLKKEEEKELILALTFIIDLLIFRR